MRAINLIGNIIWFLMGGVVMGIAWALIGVLACLTIIGIPWARSCFVISGFTFFPFGREAIDRDEYYRREDIGTGGLGFIGNIIWFFVAGIWLAIGHIMSAVACFVTIIGIPFAIQHAKLAYISLAPIGKTVVDKEEAAAARMANAYERVVGRRVY